MSGSATKAAKRNGRMAVRLSKETTQKGTRVRSLWKKGAIMYFEVKLKAPLKGIGFCPAWGWLNAVREA
jgi:hypothetical protein